jgi:hypothetical protein
MMEALDSLETEVIKGSLVLLADLVLMGHWVNVVTWVLKAILVYLANRVTRVLRDSLGESIQILYLETPEKEESLVYLDRKET